MSKAVGASGKVIAVEPQPEVAARLRANLALNRLRNVDQLQLALSSESGTGTLYARSEDDANQGTSSLYAGEPDDAARSFVVELRTIDEIAAERDLHRLDFIKIDVEGNEAKILEGALGTLARHQPVVLFEYESLYWSRAGASLAGTLNRLRELSYRFYQVKSRTLSPLDDASDFENILAVPSSVQRI
jgi:FkbM family methyltransferase